MTHSEHVDLPCPCPRCQPARHEAGCGDVTCVGCCSSVQALLLVVDELRRSNEDRALFYTTMREFFERLLEDPQSGDGSPVGSGQPAAAPGCLICGNQASKFSCNQGAALTREQWNAHRDEEYEESRKHGADVFDAERYARDKTAERFGPCPEES